MQAQKAVEFTVSPANQPGALARELAAPAEAGLEVKDGYATMPPGNESGTIVMAVSDLEKAMAALSGKKRA